MRIVVTGGAGFIGANLCRQLVARQAVSEVVAFDDLSTGRESNLAGVEGVELVVGSVLDQGTLTDVIRDADAVVHLAARPSVPRSIADPIATHRVNVDGTINVLEAVRAQTRRAHVIFASSSSVYGANPTLPKVETLATMPRSPYAASKLSGEVYVLGYQASFDIPALAFRFFNVFGPLQSPDHDYAAVVPAFIAAALRDSPLPIHGDGLQTRDFTFVGTVAGVIATAVVDRIASPGPVNLAFGTRSSLLEVTDMLEHLLGRPLERAFLPSRAGDVRDSQAANDRLRELFPDVVPVDLSSGLTATIEWMRSLLSLP